MTRDLIARLVAIADERPFTSIGHVVEHELPELRAQAEALPVQEPVARVAELEEALRKIVYEPDETASDAKALREIVRIARAALAKGE